MAVSEESVLMHLAASQPRKYKTRVFLLERGKNNSCRRQGSYFRWLDPKTLRMEWREIESGGCPNDVTFAEELRQSCKVGVVAAPKVMVLEQDRKHY